MGVLSARVFDHKNPDVASPANARSTSADNEAPRIETLVLINGGEPKNLSHRVENPPVAFYALVLPSVLALSRVIRADSFCSSPDARR